jgi:hypothetical protein
LWQRVLKELAADARWRRIVANLLLLVQIAALAGLILALAQPAFLFSASRQRHDVVLLDTSASMAATDLGPNRLRAATEMLLEELRRDRPGKVTVINAGPNPTVVYNGTASISAIKGALRHITPSDGSIDWIRVSVLARSSLSSSRTRVLLVSDAAIDSG